MYSVVRRLSAELSPSINRWAIRFLPLLEKAFRHHKHVVGHSWRMDETYIKIKGVWKYLYRAVDKEGKTVDFLLTAKRDTSSYPALFREGHAIQRDPGQGDDGQERRQPGGARADAQYGAGNTPHHSAG